MHATSTWIRCASRSNRGWQSKSAVRRPIYTVDLTSQKRPMTARPLADGRGIDAAKGSWARSVRYTI